MAVVSTLRLMTRRVFALTLAVGMLLAGCSSTTTPAATVSTHPADGGTYANTDALLAALTAAGIPCTAPSQVANPTATGATSMLDCTSSGGTPADTVVVVFDTHADAVDFQSRLYTSGMLTANSQVVVGGNWALNTVAPYGNEVEAHLGGQIENAP